MQIAMEANQFARIKDLLARDLSRPIEEVIKLSQRDEEAVFTELSEYVVTDNLRNHYEKLFKAISESIFNPTEGIGVWVSGFFGSGKSAFVKNLGYVLDNPTIRGKQAAELFIERVREAAPDDHILPDLIRNLTQRASFEVIMFDVSADRAVQREDEKLAEIMYRVLLRQLDYEYRRYEIAELEIELEREERLAEFVQTLADVARTRGWVRGALSPAELPVTLQGAVSPEAYAIWRQIRSGAQAVNRASAVLHQLDPQTYPTQESWAAAARAHPVDVTVNLLIERTFDLVARRRPGKAAFFIIDEVGQYVARSGDKILDLQGIVREFGSAGRNRVVRGEAPAPVWIVVTSQEKLSEVVDAIGDRRIDLAKLQDSFRFHIDLGPQDIQEIAARRVLAKKPEAIPFLEGLFDRHRGTLNNHVKLEQSGRFRPVEQNAFVETYPYLPHLIDLSVDIMSALRLQSGGLRHLGGSNRTIIKQAYEMLVNERTRLAEAPVGTLVTLDKVYELVAQNISSEKQRDIHEIDQAYGANSWEARVARVLALIEGVAHLPRTPRNIAALLYERLGGTLVLDEVNDALERLRAAQFARETEEGWKLLTQAEKTWEAERQEIRVTPSQEKELLQTILERLWEEPSLRRVSYKGLRDFSLHVIFQDRTITRSGDLELHLFMVDDEQEKSDRIQSSRTDTRATSHRHEVHWIFPRTPSLENALQELARSDLLIRKYDQVAAQERLSQEQRANLENEKRQRQHWQAEVERLLREALLQGVGVFRGETRAAAAFSAREWKDVVRGLVHWVVPALYEKLEEGNVDIPAGAAERVLQVSLDRLPPVFCDFDGGLGIVVSGTDGYVVNTEAPVVKAILDYLRREQEYGHSVTGKKLEDHFAGPPYGWRLELVQAVVALLLRVGLVEIVHQARRLNRPDDPQVRRIFTGARDFRTTTFRLRQQIDLRVLARAGKALEALTGEEVAPEEPSIFEKARDWAENVLRNARLEEDRARSAGLNVVLEPIQTFRQKLEVLSQSDSEEIVRMLAEEAQDLQEALQAYQRVRPVITDENLQRVRRARRVLREFWPDIEQDRRDLAGSVQEALDILEGAELPEQLDRLFAVSGDIEAAYQSIYQDLHMRRGAAYQEALEKVQSWPEWEQVEVAVREKIIQPLVERSCGTMDFDEEQGVCRQCHARISTMRSDLRAVEGFLEEVRTALREALPVDVEAPTVVRLKLRDLLPKVPLRTLEDVEQWLERLRKTLCNHIEQGEEIELE